MSCSEHRCAACRTSPVADPREPCDGCAEAFGDMLRRSDQEASAEEFARQVAEGDAAVAAIYAERREIARWSA